MGIQTAGQGKPQAAPPPRSALSLFRKPLARKIAMAAFFAAALPSCNELLVDSYNSVVQKAWHRAGKFEKGEETGFALVAKKELRPGESLQFGNGSAARLDWVMPSGNSTRVQLSLVRNPGADETLPVSGAKGYIELDNLPRIILFISAASPYSATVEVRAGK